MKKRKSILLAAVAVSMLMTFQPAKAQDVNNWTDLQQAIVNGTTPINITSNITGDGITGLGALGGSSVTINGNGYDIDGNGKDGLRVYSNNALTINNIGLSNFTGTVIKNNNTTLISDVIFSDNTTKFEGFVHNNKGLMVINDSSFLNNKFGSSGWGIVFSDASLKVNNTSFIGNTGESTYNSILHIGNGDATIVDSIFLANTSNGNSGAINNYWCNISIIADKKDSVFTGNTSKVGSNALYNEKGVIYLNAGRGIIVFNDGIDGTSGTNNIININNTGVKMSDGTTDAPTSGIVEFNNTVSNNTVNLYNGTLKLGHHAEETITVNGTQQTVAESFGSLDSSVNFIVHGGTLSLQDGGARTTNLGNVTLENDLQLAIDADLANEQADMITASSAIASNTGHSIQISDVNILSEAQKDVVSTEVADSNTKDAVTLSSNANITRADGVEKSYLLAYDKSGTTGILTFDSTNNLVNAVRRTDTERVYNMVEEEIVNETLGEMGGENSILTINGGGYDITAEGENIGGITVNSGQTLNVNNVGNSTDENSKGFNGFRSYSGGAIYNRSTATITGSTFTGNEASDYGGAIYNRSTATITDSTFTGNKAREGGAIFNWSTATITDSTFTGNSANYNGGAIYNDSGTATITGSTFTGNEASDYGGAIFNWSTATITDSTFTGNKASAYGGAIYNFGGTATITGSTFTGNEAFDYGGAIYNRSTATITDSTFTGNKAREGGAIYNRSTATITDSTFTGNESHEGGAILNWSTATITDSTFIGNEASLFGGAILNWSTANIIANESDTTFTGNTAGGMSNALFNYSGRANLNAADGHKIVFNDGIDGSNGTININNTGVKMADGTTEAPTSGTVEFNNTVSNNTVILHNGTLKLGHYEGGTINVNGAEQLVAESWGNFDETVTLNLNGGTLDTLDGAIRDYTVGTMDGTGSKLALDLNFSDNGATADNFTINDGNATLNFSDINITGDLPTTSGAVEIVKGTNTGITLGKYAVFTNDASLTFAQDTTNKGFLAYTYNEDQGGLKAAVDYADGNRQYDMNADETITQDLGVMQGSGSTLTIKGNGYDINGNGNQGITVNNGQTLTVNNVGNSTDENSKGFNGFSSSVDGGAIYNRGTTSITDSTFTGNSAGNSGGAILNIGTAAITDSTFTGNKASNNSGGAIWNNGTVTITDSIFTSNSSNFGGAINNNKILNIIAKDSQTIFTGNADNLSGSNAIRNNRNGIINLNAGEANIIFNDGISGEGKDVAAININNTGVQMPDGSEAPTLGTVEINNVVSENTVNMYNGTLLFGTNTQNGTLYTGTLADNVDFNYIGGTVSLQNGGINSANLGNLTLNSDMDLRLDANLADKTMDTITASRFNNTNGYNINISNILITEPTTEKSFSISPLGTGMDDSVRSALAGAIQYTGEDIAYSPIYKYSASYDPATAMMNFGLYGGGGGGDTPGYESFNPAVMASPVAAQLGGYLVQLNAYDNAFRNMDMYMLMTKEQRQAMKMRNRYATTNKNIVFDPTVTMYENKAGWFRPYATFENVSLNNGPKVSNVAYGSFFGAESELYDLGHGWDGMWGVYGGYNGSHQAYDGVSIYQNGGTFGAVGMAYKGNFFTGLTANVGASAGEASSMFGHEDFAMLMSGVASKTGYNWELANGKFIIQPSLLMSYSFINTFDYRNAAGVSIDSDPLHAIQLEPGIKFIGNLKNGWQPYLGVSVVWNIMDRTHFQANNVALPNLSIDPFVKYGVGVRKSWGERFTGFFQTYITNGGRNGVGLQAGFRWTLGKSEPKQQSKVSGKIPELPKTQIKLSNIK